MVDAIDIVGLTVDILLTLAILICNSLTIAAIAKFSYLQTITNVFTLSLSVADICVGLGQPLCSIVDHTDVLQGEGLRVACTICKSVTAASLAVSLSYMLLIAMDRYFMIFHPMKYVQRISKRIAVALVMIPWFYFYTMVPSVLFKTNIWKVNNPCAIMYLIPTAIYYGVLVAPLLLFISATLILYGRIFHAARKQRIRIKQQETAVGHISRSETKLAKMMALILGVYLLSYVPYVILSILRMRLGEHYLWLRLSWKFSVVLIVANSAINPFIYGWKNAAFRKAYAALLNLKCLARRVFASDQSVAINSVEGIMGKKRVSVIQTKGAWN